ncbi:hypothetical protein PVLB_18100 [Pseudomonas sp. VLB120]|nr:hypothetical protein PVLB_18100 [Pseudomonas sp. VLB120]
MRAVELSQSADRGRFGSVKRERSIRWACVTAVPQGPEGKDDVDQRIFTGTASGLRQRRAGGRWGEELDASHAFDTHMRRKVD